MDRFINDQRVEPGVLITGLATTDRVLGSTVKAGARCDFTALLSFPWVGLVIIGRAWEGAPTTSFHAADGAARDHVRES